MKNFWLTGFFLVALGLTFITPCRAKAFLDVDVNGQLLGVSNVLVNGTFYHVSFQEGSCVSIFGGCDQVSDFMFQNQRDAQAAAQVLPDQVFLDTKAGAFDSNPTLNRGIEYRVGKLLTPYALIYSEDNQSPLVATRVFQNAFAEDEDTTKKSTYDHPHRL